MPGNDVAELSFREARRQGKLEEYKEAQRSSRGSQLMENSTTRYCDSASDGKVLGVRSVRSRGKFVEAVVDAEGEVPEGYQAVLDLQRSSTEVQSSYDLSEGKVLIEDLEIGTDLLRKDKIKLSLNWNGDGEGEPIGPVTTTIVVAHNA